MDKFGLGISKALIYNKVFEYMNISKYDYVPKSKFK